MTMKYTMVIADDEPVVLKSTELFLKKEFPDRMHREKSRLL